jgi:ketosteroid isomerase-like protein
LVNPILIILLLCAPGAFLFQRSATVPGSPQAAVDGLLAADRAFSAASAKTEVVAGLSAMFADSVVMPGADGQFAKGREAVVNALRANPDNARSRIEWVPVRGGVSADGQHGFTVGSMTLHRPDTTSVPMKYLAYWVKGPGGWRVAAYKRVRAATGQSAIDQMPPALPDRLVPPSSDPAAMARFTDSLDQAERAFSRDAQRIGIGAAFSWGPDQVIVASSGDLGVTIGIIRLNTPPAAGEPAAFPFFTVWRRPNVNAPWRYIAE